MMWEFVYFLIVFYIFILKQEVRLLEEYKDGGEGFRYLIGDKRYLIVFEVCERVNGLGSIVRLLGCFKSLLRIGIMDIN